MLSLGWGERRLANIHKLLRLARRFETHREPRAARVPRPRRRSRGRHRGREADAAVAVGELDAVRLMSIHAAKGLEFPVVCLADLGRPPATPPPVCWSLAPPRALSVSVCACRRRRLRDPRTLDYEQLLAERRQAEAEEEERIVYVGMTRARERLILSGSADFSPGRSRRPPVRRSLGSPGAGGEPPPDCSSTAVSPSVRPRNRRRQGALHARALGARTAPRKPRVGRRPGRPVSGPPRQPSPLQGGLSAGASPAAS